MLSGTLAPRVLKSPRQKEGEKEIRKGQKRGKGEKGQGKEGERDGGGAFNNRLGRLGPELKPGTLASGLNFNWFNICTVRSRGSLTCM